MGLLGEAKGLWGRAVEAAESSAAWLKEQEIVQDIADTLLKDEPSPAAVNRPSPTGTGRTLKATVIHGIGKPLRVQTRTPQGTAVDAPKRLLYCWVRKPTGGWFPKGVLLTDERGTVLDLHNLLRREYVARNTARVLEKEIGPKTADYLEIKNATDELSAEFDADCSVRTRTALELIDTTSLQELSRKIAESREGEKRRNAIKKFQFVQGREYYLMFCPMDMLLDDRINHEQVQGKTIGELLDALKSPPADGSDGEGCRFVADDECLQRGTIELPVHFTEALARLYETVNDINGTRLKYGRIANYNKRTALFFDYIASILETMRDYPDGSYKELYHRLSGNRHIDISEDDAKEWVYRKKVGENIHRGISLCRQFSERIRKRYAPGDSATAKSDAKVCPRAERLYEERVESLYNSLEKQLATDSVLCTAFPDGHDALKGIPFSGFLREDAVYRLVCEAYVAVSFHPDAGKRQRFFRNDVLPLYVAVSRDSGSSWTAGLLGPQTLKVLYPQKGEQEIARIGEELSGLLAAEPDVAQVKSMLAAERIEVDAHGTFDASAGNKLLKGGYGCYKQINGMLKYYRGDMQELIVALGDSDTAKRMLLLDLNTAVALSGAAQEADNELLARSIQSFIGGRGSVDNSGAAARGGPRMDSIMHSLGLLSAVYGAHEIIQRCEKRGHAEVKDCLELYQCFSAGGAAALNILSKSDDLRQTALFKRINAVFEKTTGVANDAVSLFLYGQQCVTYFDEEEYDLVLLTSCKFSLTAASLAAQLARLSIQQGTMLTARQIALVAATNAVTLYAGIILLLMDMPEYIDLAVRAYQESRYRPLAVINSLGDKEIRARFENQLKLRFQGTEFTLGQYKNDKALRAEYRYLFKTKKDSADYKKLLDYLSSGLKHLEGFGNHMKYWNIDPEQGGKRLLEAGVPVDIICILTGKGQAEVVEWNYAWGREKSAEISYSFQEQVEDRFQHGALRILNSMAI